MEVLKAQEWLFVQGKPQFYLTQNKQIAVRIKDGICFNLLDKILLFDNSDHAYGPPHPCKISGFSDDRKHVHLFNQYTTGMASINDIEHDG